MQQQTQEGAPQANANQQAMKALPNQNMFNQTNNLLNSPFLLNNLGAQFGQNGQIPQKMEQQGF